MGTEKTISEKQYEKLMFALSIIIAKLFDKDCYTITGKPIGIERALSNIQTGDAKKVHDFLSESSLENVDAILKQRQKERMEELARRDAEEAERNRRQAEQIRAEKEARRQELIEQIAAETLRQENLNNFYNS